MFGDVILDEEGAVALVVVDKVVGAYPTGTVWRFSADEGKENMAGLVALRVVKLVPVPKTKHVTGILMSPSDKVNNSRLSVDFIKLEWLFLGIFFPVFQGCIVSVIMANNGIEI